MNIVKKLLSFILNKQIVNVRYMTTVQLMINDMKNVPIWIACGFMQIVQIVKL